RRVPRPHVPRIAGSQPVPRLDDSKLEPFEEALGDPPRLVFRAVVHRDDLPGAGEVLARQRLELVPEGPRGVPEGHHDADVERPPARDRAHRARVGTGDVAGTIRAPASCTARATIHAVV